MSDKRSESARRRWQAMTPEERRAATAAPVKRSLERRRTAFALLAAVEAAGLRIEAHDDEEAR